MTLQKLGNGNEVNKMFAIKTRARELLNSGAPMKTSIQTAVNEVNPSRNNIKGGGAKVREY
jgi:hypothetical protein